MKLFLTCRHILASGVVLAVIIGRLVTDRSPVMPRGHVYSVPQLAAALTRHRGVWVGRDILVRGRLVPITDMWVNGHPYPSTEYGLAPLELASAPGIFVDTGQPYADDVRRLTGE